MISGLPIFIILLPLTLLSKSTCEDEEYFSDSYGWTCRDYDRAPEQCELSPKFEKNGKVALTSCCACRSNLLKHDISDDLWSGFPVRFDTKRRLSDSCLMGCDGESDICEGYCNSDLNVCNLRCKDVKSACTSKCEDEDPTEEPEDPDAIVEETPTPASGTTQIWLYILIGAIVLLSLICCCIIVYCLMRSRVETDVDCPSPDFCTEQAPMVENACVQEVGDCYMPATQQYTQCGGYTTAAPIQNQRIHSQIS